MRAILLVKARTIVSSDEEARDVIQEAFCNLWTKCPEIERQSQAEAILSTTVRNLSIDKLRRRNAHPTDSIDDSTEPPDIDNSSGEETVDIYRRVESLAAKTLSERDRMILFRRDRDEWSFEDIAKQYDITPANARLIVARARKTIRNIYRNNDNQ